MNEVYNTAIGVCKIQNDSTIYGNDFLENTQRINSNYYTNYELALHYVTEIYYPLQRLVLSGSLVVKVHETNLVVFVLTMTHDDRYYIFLHRESVAFNGKVDEVFLSNIVTRNVNRVKLLGNIFTVVVVRFNSVERAHYEAVHYADLSVTEVPDHNSKRVSPVQAIWEHITDRAVQVIHQIL